ncbi:TPA: hypothetical protein ACUUCQ_005159 [Pseudomonas aeruginosa]
MSMELNKALDLLRGLVSEVEHKTCCHEETHRGGAIWEICDSCGAKWADDEGGKPEFAWPESVEKAREFLATHPAVEQAGKDERIVKTAPERIYLIVGDECPRDADFGELSEVTWCEDEHAAGIEYVRADKARAALAQPSPAQAEQAEAERPEVVAYFDRNYPSTGDAFIWSNYEGSPYEPVMTVAQHERIVGELRTEIAMLRSYESEWELLLNQHEQERDAAQARVAELEMLLRKLSTNGLMQFSTADEEMAVQAALGGAPVAQAQHSVPELDQLYSMLGAESQVDAAKKIAELIGCRMSRSALTEAQMRRIYENSTEIENERLGFAAFARLMRRAEAVHQIAAAPGKEGV